MLWLCCVKGKSRESSSLHVSIWSDILKLVSAIFYQNFIFSPYDSPSNTMKNVFYLI